MEKFKFKKMKQFIIKSFLIIFLFVFWGCDKSKIYMKYHFFSTSELENVCMNTDSIMKFQSKISKIETFDEFDGKQHIYYENDTVMFYDENGDTVTCMSNNTIDVTEQGDALVINPDTKTRISLILYCIDSSLNYIASFSLRKPSEMLEDSLSRGVELRYPFNNPKAYNTYLCQSGIKNQDNTYSIVSKETYVLNDTPIDNCLFVRFYDASSTEQALLVYSNKYGFLKIKDTQHEITRIL